MATEEERNQQHVTVIEQIKELAEIDPEALARTSDLSKDINFTDAVPLFRQMLDLCKQLSQRDLSRLTYSQLSGIHGGCQQLSTLIKRVEDFKLDQNTPGAVCKQLVDAVANAYDTVMEPMLLPLAFTATQATDYAKIEREAKGYHATMQKEADDFFKSIANIQREAESALSAVKEQAAESGVATNAQIFVGDANKHKQTALRWFKATVVMATITFVAAVAALTTVFYYHPENLAATIQYVVGKLLVFSTLSFVVLWCIRNYRSQKHNEILNQHRANALMTFRAFVEGTADNRVKDAILLQASQAAFSGHSTGFDAPEKNSTRINPVVEILGKNLPHSSE